MRENFVKINIIITYAIYVSKNHGHDRIAEIEVDSLKNGSFSHESFENATVKIEFVGFTTDEEFKDKKWSYTVPLES